MGSNPTPRAIYKDQHFRSDVLKLGHHGNKTGTGKDFVAAVKPDIAIASTADDSGHTLDTAVRKSLTGCNSVNNNKCLILQTLTDGDIRIQTAGKKVNRNGRVGVLYKVTAKT